MKKKLQKPRLSLNKRTIANLNKIKMDRIVGGGGNPNDSNGINNQNICDTDVSGFKPINCPELPHENSINICPKETEPKCVE